MVVSSNSDSVPRRSGMDTRQFLGVADPQFAGHQFGEEGVTQGGEGAGFGFIVVPEIEQGSRESVEAREELLRWYHHRKTVDVIPVQRRHRRSGIEQIEIESLKQKVRMEWTRCPKLLDIQRSVQGPEVLVNEIHRSQLTASPVCYPRASNFDPAVRARWSPRRKYRVDAGCPLRCGKVAAPL